MDQRIQVANADGTPHGNGWLEKETTVCLITKTETRNITLLLGSLGHNRVFLGHDWLYAHNPCIDWRKKTITYREHSTIGEVKATDWEKTLEQFEREKVYMREVHSTETIQTPAHLTQFQDIFAQESFNKLPPHRKWDHAIDLIPGEDPPNEKGYPLNLHKLGELDQFLKDNLRSG